MVGIDFEGLLADGNGARSVSGIKELEAELVAGSSSTVVNPEALWTVVRASLTSSREYPRRARVERLSFTEKRPGITPRALNQAPRPRL